MRLILSLLIALQAAPVLSDLDRAQAETHVAHVQLLACQEQLVRAQITLQTGVLTEQQAVLEKRFREILQPPAGATFDWSTLRFTVPKE